MYPYLSKLRTSHLAGPWVLLIAFGGCVPPGLEADLNETSFACTNEPGILPCADGFSCVVEPGVGNGLLGQCVADTTIEVNSESGPIRDDLQETVPEGEVAGAVSTDRPAPVGGQDDTEVVVAPTAGQDQPTDGGMDDLGAGVLSGTDETTAGSTLNCPPVMCDGLDDDCDQGGEGGLSASECPSVGGVDITDAQGGDGGEGGEDGFGGQPFTVPELTVVWAETARLELDQQMTFEVAFETDANDFSMPESYGYVWVLKDMETLNKSVAQVTCEGRFIFQAHTVGQFKIGVSIQDLGRPCDPDDIQLEVPQTEAWTQDFAVVPNPCAAFNTTFSSRFVIFGFDESSTSATYQGASEACAALTDEDGEQANFQLAILTDENELACLGRQLGRPNEFNTWIGFQKTGTNRFRWRNDAPVDNQSNSNSDLTGPCGTMLASFDEEDGVSWSLSSRQCDVVSPFVCEVCDDCTTIDASYKLALVSTFQFNGVHDVTTSDLQGSDSDGVSRDDRQDLDFAVVEASSSNIIAHYQTAFESFTGQSNSLSTGYANQRIRFADVATNDGDELVSLTTDGELIVFFLGVQANNTVTQTRGAINLDQNVVHAEVVDLNGDGNQNIVYVVSNDDGSSSLKWLGESMTLPEESAPQQPAPQTLANLANGTLITDMVPVTHEDGDALFILERANGQSSVKALSVDASGGIETEVIFRGLSDGLEQLLPGEFGGLEAPGPDIAFVGPSPLNSWPAITIYYRQGNGEFDVSPSHVLDGSPLGVGEALSGLENVAAADLDGDGRDDFLIPINGDNHHQRTVLFLNPQGAGPILHQSLPFMEKVVFRDLNHDGRADLIGVPPQPDGSEQTPVLVYLARSETNTLSGLSDNANADCIDTDGADVSVLNISSGTLGNAQGLRADTCLTEDGFATPNAQYDGGAYILEYVCESSSDMASQVESINTTTSFLVGKVFRCPGACSNGACVTSPAACIPAEANDAALVAECPLSESELDASFSCSENRINAPCVITACADTFYDLDGDPGNGCECQDADGDGYTRDEGACVNPTRRGLTSNQIDNDAFALPDEARFDCNDSIDGTGARVQPGNETPLTADHDCNHDDHDCDGIANFSELGFACLPDEYKVYERAIACQQYTDCAAACLECALCRSHPDGCTSNECQLSLSNAFSSPTIGQTTASNEVETASDCERRCAHQSEADLVARDPSSFGEDLRGLNRVPEPAVEAWRCYRETRGVTMNDEGQYEFSTDIDPHRDGWPEDVARDCGESIRACYLNESSNQIGVGINGFEQLDCRGLDICCEYFSDGTGVCPSSCLRLSQLYYPRVEDVRASDERYSFTSFLSLSKRQYGLGVCAREDSGEYRITQGDAPAQPWETLCAHRAGIITDSDTSDTACIDSSVEGEKACGQFIECSNRCTTAEDCAACTLGLSGDGLFELGELLACYGDPGNECDFSNGIPGENICPACVQLYSACLE